MKLHIENFAKISSADIAFDGFTVIAGNTGCETGAMMTDRMQAEETASAAVAAEELTAYLGDRSS